MAASLHHDSFQFGVGKRSAEHGHGSFAVDHRGHTQLFIRVARLPKPLTARLALRADANSFFGAANEPASAATLPRKVRRFQFERGRIGKLLYLCATAAMQLISSSECPGTPAADIVVLAGPPCGK